MSLSSSAESRMACRAPLAQGAKESDSDLCPSYSGASEERNLESMAVALHGSRFGVSGSWLISWLARSLCTTSSSCTLVESAGANKLLLELLKG